MRLRRVQACIGIVALVGLSRSVAEAENAASPAPVIDFELGSTAGVVDFKFSYPNLFIPFVVTGGIVESTTLASGLGRAQGLAGLMPIPIASSAGLLVPDRDPITSQPIPSEVREAIKAIDFSGFPNSCQSEYPGTAESAERYCGGPAAEDARLGFTADVANGHTRSSGRPDDGLQAQALSEAQVVNATVPALQMFVEGAASTAHSGLNPQGVPEATAIVTVDSLSFLSGLIRLDGVHAETVAVSDGTEEGTTVRSHFTVRAAKIAGVPVTIGPGGVSLGNEAVGEDVPVLDDADAVDEALKAHDVEIRLVPANTVRTSGHQVEAHGAAIEIVHRGTSITPADSVYRFGFTSVRANAVVAGRSEPEPEAPTPDGRTGEPHRPGTPVLSREPAPVSSPNQALPMADPPAYAAPTAKPTEPPHAAEALTTKPTQSWPQPTGTAVTWAPRRLPPNSLQNTFAMVTVAVCLTIAIVPTRRILSRFPG